MMESVRLGPQVPPRMNLEGQHAGVIKRIRQACRNCRYAMSSMRWSVKPFHTPIPLLDQRTDPVGSNHHGSHDD